MHRSAVNKESAIIFNRIFEMQKLAQIEQFLTESGQFRPSRFRINHVRIKDCGGVGGVIGLFTLGILYESPVIAGRRLASNAGGSERPALGRFPASVFLLGDARAPQGGRDQMSHRNRQGEIDRKGLE